MEKENKVKTDQELVALTLADHRAFTSIVEKYQNILRRYLAHIGCLSRSDQDDILQEAFLKIYLNLNDYDPDLKFSSWVYRITHNEAVSFFRKKNISPAPVANDDDLGIFLNLIDDTDIIEAQNKKFEAELVRQALAKLEKQYRDTLILKFIEDKSYEEISDILKIPIGTVGTLINRGKKQLKNILYKKI
ncbi:MAG: RNA polymerase sigma factor [Patescibacteria group bacterium]|nr:RNA polymerase sigma factor [Patescibacteria group bacterium]